MVRRLGVIILHALLRMGGIDCNIGWAQVGVWWRLVVLRALVGMRNSYGVRNKLIETR